MTASKIIVVIGGTGHFGTRICRRVIRLPNIELIIASRHEKTALTLIAELKVACPGAIIRAATLDQTKPDFEVNLRRLKPDIVLHTAGPYQGQDYRVAKASIECRAHYIDLADGREFVAGFSCLNEDALRNNVLAVSGASTLPGLSSAVIDSLRDRFQAITQIEISIAPGHQTPRGRSTIAAVLSYCGKPFEVWLNNKWAQMYGWQNLRIQRYPSLGWRLLGACDVPDLVLLPRFVPGCQTVTFHAALEAIWEQVALWCMAWLSRVGVVRDWSRFVPAFDWLGKRLIKLGSDSGGMHIRLRGIGKNGESKTCDWHLTAHNNHGPEIPCLPALALLRKLLNHELSLRGATACLGLISLADFRTEIADLDISWEVLEHSDDAV